MHEPIIHASYPGRPGHYVSLELYLFHDDGRLITDPEQDVFVCHPCYVGLDPTRTEATIDLPSLLPASLLSDPAAPLRAVGILFGQGNLEDLTLRTTDGKEYGGPFRVIVFCLNQEPTLEAPETPPALHMTRPIFVLNLDRADYPWPVDQGKTGNAA